MSQVVCKQFLDDTVSDLIYDPCIVTYTVVELKVPGIFRFSRCVFFIYVILLFHVITLSEEHPVLTCVRAPEN